MKTATSKSLLRCAASGILAALLLASCGAETSVTQTQEPSGTDVSAAPQTETEPETEAYPFEIRDLGGADLNGDGKMKEDEDLYGLYTQGSINASLTEEN